MMKKMFVAPEAQVIALCEEDILTVSGVDAADAMVLELDEIFATND